MKESIHGHRYFVDFLNLLSTHIHEVKRCKKDVENMIKKNAKNFP